MTPQRTLKGRTKSKSKTFEVETLTADMYGWMCKNIETVQKQFGVDDEYDLPYDMSVTAHKYIITVTKVEDDEDKVTP